STAARAARATRRSPRQACSGNPGTTRLSRTCRAHSIGSDLQYSLPRHADPPQFSWHLAGRLPASPRACDTGWIEGKALVRVDAPLRAAQSQRARSGRARCHEMDRLLGVTEIER